ncbi:YkvA family protein [Wansuia hejianensis]|uniref:DUF1232 domain-containing protein n=1 Tax=Wansuia hejianensis TaxID=2763667 RepID=A0A926IN94_9FIRM|nr:hypothetical protein [Wansuia hejianensis]MBC8591421.1 hypothetical protein [Wansuia hejianensis]
MRIDIDALLEGLNQKFSSINIDSKRINQVLEDVKTKVESNETFSDFVEDIKTCMDMLVDWKNGKYTNISKNTINTVIIGLLYIANPLDILPKFLKKTILDDIFVIGYILKKIKAELEIYRQWKEYEEPFKEETPEESSQTIYIEL